MFSEAQQEPWYCPPCQNEKKVEEKARHEGWTTERLEQTLKKMQHQRITIGMHRDEYEDPLPQLK